MRHLALYLLLLAPSLPAIGEPHAAILMYHRFGEARYPSTNIRLQQFTAQLDYLQREGFTILPLHHLLDALFQGKKLPERSVALTVDDAYLSLYENAYPILRKRKLPLTVFVSTDAVDQGHSGYMSWEQMREMQKHGIDFANHGQSHESLSTRHLGEVSDDWRARITKEILRAQQRIDAELGNTNMRLLAYPYGEFSEPLRALVDELGFIAFGQHSGPIGPRSQRTSLPRFPINERLAGLDSFALKVSSLPLPLTQTGAQEPQLQNENPPTLMLKLAAGYEKLGRRLTCYLGNGTPLTSEVDKSGNIRVRAHTPLKPGRSRYNCTAPNGDGRYYWFSQPWLNRPDAMRSNR